MGRKKFVIDEPCILPFAHLGVLAKVLLAIPNCSREDLQHGEEDLHRAAFADGEFDSVSTAEVQVEQGHYRSVPSSLPVSAHVIQRLVH